MHYQQYETLFTNWNIPFELIEDRAVESIRRTESQVRDIAHIALPANVERYATQMSAGAQFPPLVMWGGRLIDGNTRLAAAKKIGRATIPAYEVELPSLQLAMMLAAALNAINGEGLTGEEARRAALDFIDQGFSDAQIAMYLGVTAESARKWRRLAEVSERAARTGTVEIVAGLSKPMQMELAKITHDQPFRDLAHAIAETRPETRDVKSVVDQIKDATSDDAAITIVAAAKQEWTPIGPTPTRYRPNRKAQQARMHIGGLLKCDPEELIEPGRTAADLEKYERLAELVNRVIGLLRDQETAAA